MTYDIEGWIELRGSWSESWQPMVDLGCFGLHGSPESDFLFGLRKEPSGAARFAGRGIPSDASEPVLLAHARYGRAGEIIHHTHATFAEAGAALREPDAPAPDEWSHIIEHVPILWCLGKYDPPAFRFVVWANW